MRKEVPFRCPICRGKAFRLVTRRTVVVKGERVKKTRRVCAVCRRPRRFRAETRDPLLRNCIAVWKELGRL